MPLPYFFDANISSKASTYTLDELASKHCIQVLRMQVNDTLMITNGQGYSFKAVITAAHKKNTQVKIVKEIYQQPTQPQCTIAIAPIKNASRWEWFLEKATELGIHIIIPIITERTEKQYNKIERQQNILVAAMLQSQQVWLPKLMEPIFFKMLWKQVLPEQRFIAHCATGDKQPLQKIINATKNTLILIGPEGDFTTNEIDIAQQHQCIAVSLGQNRLRTETAGIFAATAFQLIAQ